MMTEDIIIAYQAPMLPQVDYNTLDEDDYFSLTHLEYNTLQSYRAFLEGLKPALIAENLLQSPVLIVSYLCAYLGTVITIHTVMNAEALESLVVNLIKHQADVAYQHFNQYSINHTIKNKKQKSKNLEELREKAPGSIIAQTVRLGRMIMDLMEDLKSHHRPDFKRFYSQPPSQQTQEKLFCSQEMLIKIMLLVGAEKCAEWRKDLDGLSDNYVINQMAIQMGWLIGYFAHLDSEAPEETQYLEYGLGLLSFYREATFRLMETHAETVYAEEAKVRDKKSEEAKSLLADIQHLSEKTHAQSSPPVTEFQKHIAIIQAGIEKTLVELLNQGYAPKIILMSVFYFWFNLEAPLYAKNPKTVQGEDALSHMTKIIFIAKKAITSKPTPVLSLEIQALNAKMQQLKRDHLPNPEHFDQEMPDNLHEQTAHVNTSIHTFTSDYLKQKYPLEAIAIVLFNQWLHMSVFFGVSESDWQKMDYYFKEILEETRTYLRKKLN